jgi:hypothetical protein
LHEFSKMFKNFSDTVFIIILIFESILLLFIVYHSHHTHSFIHSLTRFTYSLTHSLTSQSHLALCLPPVSTKIVLVLYVRSNIHYSRCSQSWVNENPTEILLRTLSLLTRESAWKIVVATTRGVLMTALQSWTQTGTDCMQMHDCPQTMQRTIFRAASPCTFRQQKASLPIPFFPGFCLNEAGRDCHPAGNRIAISPD